MAALVALMLAVCRPASGDQAALMRARALAASSSVADTSGPVYLRRGEIAYRERRFDDAADTLRHATRLLPDSARAWDLLGRSLYRLGNYTGAENALREATRREPRSPEFYTHLGLVLLAQNRLSDASATFFAALGIDASHAEARYNLGYDHQRRKQYPLAGMQFRRVIREHPDYFPARIAFAIVLRSQEKYDESDAALVAVIERDSTYSDAWVERGMLAVHRRRYPDALSHFRRALDHEHGSARARYGLGLTLTFQREWVAAQQQCDSLAMLDAGLARRLQRVITP